MATVLVHMKVKPGCEARFEELARHMYEVSHAKERDVRRYEYWRGAEPGRYYALESFDETSGFVAHQTSDHHDDAAPELRSLFEEIRLEWVDPLAGASPLTPTDAQRVPEGATEHQAAVYRSVAADIQEWWSPLRERSPRA